jgi:hypothetical protein
MGWIMIHQPGDLPSAAELDKAVAILEQHVVDWEMSTLGRGTMDHQLCICPMQGDFDEDDFITALDLAAEIDVLFAGRDDAQDPDCPTTRGDLDCDDFTTALDLAIVIDHLFADGEGPCDPCAP